MDMNNLVCRTCLGIISEGKVAHSVDDENGLIRNVRNIREMITFCVPEMDMYVSVSPLICESCLGILINAYNFKIRCLRVENAVRSYITTNNVLEGSCVNLNNIVRQQIVEALKQKQWPQKLINEYVNKHLCVAKTPQARPTLQLYQSMTQTFNAPRTVHTTGPRLPAPNALEIPSLVNVGGNITPPVANTNNLLPPYEGPHFRPPVPGPQASGYLVVSKNLMPSSGVDLLSPGSGVTGFGVQPAGVQFPALQSPGTPLLPTTLGDMQNFFLNALHLTSSASGGREEAVLLNKKEPKKKTARKSKNPRPSKAPVRAGLKGSLSSVSAKDSLVNVNAESTGLLVKALCPSTGLMQSVPLKQDGGSKGTLRKVRKNMITSVGRGNSSVVQSNDDVIILDDDADMGTQRVGEETLLMNFDEKVDALVDGGMPDGSLPASANKTLQFNKKMFVKLPMIDKETLKRKLTPEDVREEILSKRRKLVVKLSNRLPYLHQNKKLMVKVSREKFYSCMFCKFAVKDRKMLRTHYKSKHKVCGVCSFKCDKAFTLNNHINKEHARELLEALKRIGGDKMSFSCYLCNYTGVSESDLRDHRLRVHIKCNTSGMYQCPYATCLLEYPIAYAIARHIETLHGRSMQMQCPLCNYSAQSPYYLKKHIETHSKVMMMTCDLCSFGCKTSFSLKLHMKRHAKSQQENTTGLGMIYAPNLTEDDDDDDEITTYNEDYRITLDSLQPRTTESQPTISSYSNQNKGLIGHSIPSFSEMLCNQNLCEETSDQEGDCTIVSEALTRRRGRPSKPAVYKRTKGITRTSETLNSDSIDDPDDCMIVVQEIPTVDLSDDEEVASTSGKKRRVSSSGDAQTNSDIIEIDNHDDCFVISNDLPVTTASSGQESTQEFGNIAIREQSTDDSQTDTRSEALVSQKEKSPESTIVGSETDTSSLSAGDISSRKTGSENVENADKEKSMSSDQEGPENPQNTPSQVNQIVPFAVGNEGTSEDTVEGVKVVKDTLNQKTGVSDSFTEENVRGSDMESSVGGIEAVIIDGVGISENKDDASENTAQDTFLDPLKVPEKPGVSNKRSRRIVSEKETLQATKTLLHLLDPNLSDTNSEIKSPQDSQNILIVPDVTCPESVLIESSDEDSDDCTFVSESNSEKNATVSEIADGSDSGKESERSEVQCNPETVIGETSIENDAAELVESQMQFKNNASDNISTLKEFCEVTSEKINASESSSSKGVGKSNDEHIPSSDDNIVISTSEPKHTSKSQSIELLETSQAISGSDKSNFENLEEIPSSEISQKAADVVKDVLEILGTDKEIEGVKIHEFTQNEAVTEKTIESIMESPSKSTMEESANNLNNETSEAPEKIAYMETIVPESSVMASKHSKISQESKAVDLESESIGIREEDLTIVTENTKKSDVDTPIDAQKYPSGISEDTVSDEVEPGAKCSGRTKDNLVQVACADSTVSDCVSESDNVSSYLSKPAQNTLDRRDSFYLSKSVETTLDSRNSSDLSEPIQNTFNSMDSSDVLKSPQNTLDVMNFPDLPELAQKTLLSRDFSDLSEPAQSILDSRDSFDLSKSVETTLDSRNSSDLSEPIQDTFSSMDSSDHLKSPKNTLDVMNFPDLPELAQKTLLRKDFSDLSEPAQSLLDSRDSSNLSNPSQNTLGHRKDECNKNMEENILVDLGKAVFSDVIESQETSTHLDVKDKVDKGNTDTEAQDNCEVNVKKSTVSLNSTASDVLLRDISVEKNTGTEASGSDTPVNIDSGLDTIKD